MHAGTYGGVIEITRSGSAARPITLSSAGDGPVALQATLPPARCSDTGPTLNRAIQIKAGTDYWTIQGLEIAGGILVQGSNLSRLDRYLWDRRLPGRGLYDPMAARRTLESLGVDGADYIQILDNRIRGRGIWTPGARFGRIERNEIYDIACGTGGGIWLGRFSDGWTIRNNHIHDIEDSAGNHWQSEGIRTAAASRYNIVENNVVERVEGMGRGITTDVNAGWNVIHGNIVRQANIGFSEEKGGWGNEWTENTASDNVRYGFAIGPPDQPALNDTVPAFLKVNCNVSLNDPVALRIGSVQKSVFENNTFGSVELSRNALSYWTAAGNSWNGSPAPPPPNPPVASADCPSSAGPRIWGDVNRDFVVDGADALVILHQVAGLDVGDADLDLGDVDGDSKVTSSDALIILHYEEGLPTGNVRVGTPAS